MFPLEKEYEKKTGITPQDIQHLREWLKTQPHLPSEHITDLDLILVLHSCNRSFEVSKKLVDTHYTLNTLFSSYFQDRKFDSTIEHTLRYALVTPLPTRAYDGSAMMYGRFTNSDPKLFNFVNCIRTLFMTFDVFQYQEGTWPGLIIIADFNGCTLGHIMKLDLINLRQLLYYTQEALLVKLKGLFFINVPSFINKLIMMINPFMKPELMKLFQIHTAESKTLEKYFPIDAIPKESGTDGNTIEDFRNKVIANLKANAAFFEESNKKRVNEALRPDAKKTISDIFGGVEGSFKRLDID